MRNREKCNRWTCQLYIDFLFYLSILLLFKLLRLIVWCLTLFTTVFRLYCGGQCTYLCFPGVLQTILFPSHWLLSHITILGKNISRAGDRTGDVLFAKLVRYELSYGARLQTVAIWWITSLLLVSAKILMAAKSKQSGY